MFGRSKHCEVCGMDVDAEKSPKRFGKHFCSDSCAQKYSEMRMSQKQDDSHRGGCC